MKAQFIYENLNKFTRGQDPKVAMNIGDEWTRKYNEIYSVVKNIASKFNIDNITDLSSENKICITFNIRNCEYSLSYDFKLTEYKVMVERYSDKIKMSTTAGYFDNIDKAIYTLYRDVINF